jgi:hypothetical protein
MDIITKARNFIAVMEELIRTNKARRQNEKFMRAGGV